MFSAVIAGMAALDRIGDVGVKIDRLDAKVLQRILELEERQKMHSEWTDAQNVKHWVDTPQNDGESADAWAARHKLAVEALKALYPPA